MYSLLYSPLADDSRATPFLESLREDWGDFFQVEFFKAEVPLKAQADDTWKEYLDVVCDHIRETAPDIIPFFGSTHKTLQDIGTELCEKISTTIKSISGSASQIHPAMVESFRASLIPHFREALKITGTKTSSPPHNPKRITTQLTPLPNPRNRPLRRASILPP